MLAILKRRNTEYLGCFFTAKALTPRSGAAQRERYYKTGRGRDELDKMFVERSPRRQVGGSNPLAPTSSIRK